VADRRPADPDLGRYVRTMVVAGLAATATYLYLMLDLLDRRVFSNFYDLQARALLDGHIDVPAGSLGIEAFVVDGNHHLYFPPGPALLRMPLFAVTDRFDGRLTPVSMLAAWFVTLVLVALLIWRVRRLLRGREPLARWEAVAYGLLLVAGTAGSVVLFLGSIPWVYHEAYAWAIAMALGAAYSLLGVIESPSTGRILATGLFTLGAVLSRTTAGWAMAGAVLLTAIFLPRGRRLEDKHLWWKIYLAGLVPVGVGMAVNWAKFRHPYLFPLEDQVFTSLNQHRRDALAANGGDLFSPDMIWSTAVNYFRPNGIRFISLFPYITLPPEIAQSYGGGFIDQANRTGSVVNFMPLLFGLTVWGVITAFRPGAGAGAKLTRLPLLGVLAIPAGIMFYAYIAHRYTSEFVPLLLVGSAIGLVDVARRLARRGRRAHLVALGAVGGLAAFGVAAHLAAALNTQALANPGPVLQDYVHSQDRLSGWTGDPIDGYVVASDELPLQGPADQLRIVGDCQALFLGGGDEFRPWSEVGVRELDLAVRLLGTDGLPRRGRLLLAEFTGHRTTELSLERVEDQYRFRVGGRGSGDVTEWFDLPAGSTIELRVATGNPLNYVITTSGDERLEVLKENYDEDWRWMPNVLYPRVPSAAAAAAEGVDVEARETPPLEVCEELLAGDGD
jgi:hypothetical protein